MHRRGIHIEVHIVYALAVIYIHGCEYIYIYINIYVYVHICVCIYIYIYILFHCLVLWEGTAPERFSHRRVRTGL